MTDLADSVLCRFKINDLGQSRADSRLGLAAAEAEQLGAQRPLGRSLDRGQSAGLPEAAPLPEAATEPRRAAQLRPPGLGASNICAAAPCWHEPARIHVLMTDRPACLLPARSGGPCCRSARETERTFEARGTNHVLAMLDITHHHGTYARKRGGSATRPPNISQFSLGRARMILVCYAKLPS